ncbi:hypothetical protein KSS87_018687, partial [Heliosperma pusillum]
VRDNKSKSKPELREKEGRMRRGKAWEIIRKRNAFKSKGLDLIKILQSEITHQLSSPCFQDNPSDSSGDFTLEWDAPHSQDVVLRKKCDTGEEVAVSAVLGSYLDTGGTYPRRVNMKVCIKKAGLSSLLQFDCSVLDISYGDPELNITSAHYLPSRSSIGRRYYTAPLFRDLDPDLQAAFKKYLEAKGIGQTLMSFLQQHMHKKEETQYVNWLQKLQEMVS